MANENRTYDLRVEKTIPKPPTEVFRAISEGLLFMNCGADNESLKIDFRVGGKYSIHFLSHDMKNQGEFLEIIPYSKIVFTWCQDFDSNPNPDTKVFIELKDVGGKTALSLIHSGFTDIENRDAHQGGWSGGLDDLGQEIAGGKLRILRKYSLPIAKLYDICHAPAALVGKMASAPKIEVLENVPNQKIVFNWKSPSESDTRVTLLFEAEDDPKDGAWIELIHEGLDTDTMQKKHRKGWNALLKQLM